MLTRSLAERAWARMCPNLISLYGATEVGAIATADARVTTRVPGAVGHILPDAQVQIVDPSDKQRRPERKALFVSARSKGLATIMAIP